VLGVVFALVALAVGEAVGASAVAPLVAALTWLAVCWALAFVGDRVDRTTGDVARGAAFGVLPFVIDMRPSEALVVSASLAVLVVLDALRTRRVTLAYAAIAPAVIAEIAGIALAGFELAPGGIVLCVTATVWLGAAALVRDPWRLPLAAGGAVNATIGLTGALPSAETAGPGVLIVGALGFGAALMVDDRKAMHVSAAIATVGIWMTLTAQQVTASEAFVAPVALHLLAIGLVLRAATDQRPSSWVAYGPAISLFAASALAERVGGGGAWHSLLAGAVGVVAVAAGGWKRASAPLLIGTATLVAVVVRETLDQSAGVPTWAWLAVGGSSLIAVAVAMERKDVSPVEAGRRIVDVMSTTFD
jgi:hypothetical protein